MNQSQIIDQTDKHLSIVNKVCATIGSSATANECIFKIRKLKILDGNEVGFFPHISIKRIYI